MPAGLLYFFPFFVAGVDLEERLVGFKFLYKSYSSALENLRGAWMSEFFSACLKLVTVHLSMGGIVGLVDRYDDAGEAGGVLAGGDD